MCVENIKLGGDAGEFPGSANQSGTIIIGGKTYFAEAEMTKRIDHYYKGHGDKSCPATRGWS